MVARIISGQNIRGVLNYNELKVRDGVAECILVGNFFGEPAELKFYDKLNRFTSLMERNKVTRTNALHISLNFDVSESLTKEKLGEIAATYMDKIGFGDQPYLVYHHKDAGHPHIHIVTTNIQEDGSRISIHNIGRNQSEKARKEIEKQFNLMKAESKKKVSLDLMHPLGLKKAIYGKVETKRTITNIVTTVARYYKFTSVPEFNAILRQFNVLADQGTEGSQMRANNGILYRILDDNGNKVGVPLKASSIDGKPTFKNLQKLFKLNERLRKEEHKTRLRSSIHNALNRATVRTAKDLVDSLKNDGIFTLFRTNKEGRIFGVTFVDNTTRVVFNGSDLGKQYSAKAILDRLSSLEKSPKAFQPIYPEHETDSSKEYLGSYTDLELDRLVKDLITAKQSDYSSPESALRLRKKKRRKGRSR